MNYPHAGNVRILDILKNGATVIAIGAGDQDWRLVLCATTDGKPRGRREYVTWKLDGDGVCHYGEYGQSFYAEVETFKHRNGD